MILYLVICVFLLLYRLSIKYHTCWPSPGSGLYRSPQIWGDLNSFNMYTRGRRGGSLGDSNTSETPIHKISNMEVDTEAQKFADELRVIGGKCITLRLSPQRNQCKDRIHPANTQFQFLPEQQSLSQRGPEVVPVPAWPVEGSVRR